MKSTDAEAVPEPPISIANLENASPACLAGFMAGLWFVFQFDTFKEVSRQFCEANTKKDGPNVKPVTYYQLCCVNARACAVFAACVVPISILFVGGCLAGNFVMAVFDASVGVLSALITVNLGAFLIKKGNEPSAGKGSEPSSKNESADEHRIEIKSGRGASVASTKGRNILDAVKSEEDFKNAWVFLNETIKKLDNKELSFRRHLVDYYVLCHSYFLILAHDFGFRELESYPETPGHAEQEYRRAEYLLRDYRTYLRRKLSKHPKLSKYVLT